MHSKDVHFIFCKAIKQMSWNKQADFVRVLDPWYGSTAASACRAWGSQYPQAAGGATGVGAENQWVSSTVSDSGTSTGVTTGPPGTLTDTGKAWTVNVWAGFMVWSNNKTMIIASNTATVLT